jgi:hydroxymethylbilane synthase
MSSGRQRITLGTRGSRLALAQAGAVAAALRRAVPGLDVQLTIIATEGDRVTAGPLPSWGRGVFVREIEQALLRGEIDLAVHSLKDVPAAVPDRFSPPAARNQLDFGFGIREPTDASPQSKIRGPAPAGDPKSKMELAIVAVPPRGAPGDVLVTADGRGLDALAPGARVGTSSLRRAAFLRAYRPDLDFVPVRGNVDTRWRKLLDPAQGYDALALAAAGLERLGLAEAPRVPIPYDVLLPAPGQGALALEARAGDEATRAIAAAVDDPPTAAAVAAERRALRDLEGGCRLPVGALARIDTDGTLVLAAAVAAPDGSQVIRHEARGTVAEPDSLGAAVASILLARGAARLLREAAPVEAAV